MRREESTHSFHALQHIGKYRYIVPVGNISEIDATPVNVLKFQQSASSCIKMGRRTRKMTSGKRTMKKKKKKTGEEKAKLKEWVEENKKKKRRREKKSRESMKDIQKRG